MTGLIDRSRRVTAQANGAKTSVSKKSGVKTPAASGIQVPPSPTATTVQLETGLVTGRITPDGGGLPLAILIDAVMVATGVTSGDGAFKLPIPPHTLAGTVDILTIPDGRTVLDAPLTLPGASRIAWYGWACRSGQITGHFRILGDDDASTTPVLVQAYAGTRLLLQTFAVPTEGVHVFKGTVRHLLANGPATTIRPRIAGLELDIPLDLTAQTVGIVGHLDPTDRLEGRGWAIDLTDRTRRVDIDIRLDGRTIASGPATGFREDLKQLALSDGNSGFTFPFPPKLDRRADITVRAFLAGTDTELVDSPYTLAALPPVIGYFDAVEGPFAGGWAVNMHDPASPLDVEALCDGEVIGQGTANLYRSDVEKAGLPTPWCGFRFLLDRSLVTLFDKDIYLRVTGTDRVLAGSPRQISQNGNIVRFLTRANTIPIPSLQRLVRRMTHQTTGAAISIIMPVYNTKREWLVAALNSVLAQWTANWELIVVDDGSTEPHVAELLDTAARHDWRIRVMRSPGNLGIARATNFGLRAARCDYVAFMDHDDVIEPDAIYRLAMAARQTGADFIYSDEAITTDDINSIIEVRARPAFSHDYYMSHPYFVHMVCVRTTLAQQLGGWDETLPISADVDFVLRAIEGSKAVAHVPAVLYRWRTHGGSAGHAKQAQVTEAMKGILTRHLARQNLPATVRDGFRYNEYRLDWPDDGGEVLVVIPTKNRVDLLKPCIDSIERTSPGANIRIVVIDHQSTDKKTVRYLQQIASRHTVMPYTGPFNYALMNNLAVKTHGRDAKYVLLLNNDVEAREMDWIPRLRSLAARPGVGAVGPMLLYGDDRIQHAGVLMAFSGAADHAMKFQDAYITKGQRHPGYNCNLTSVRDYSAITAACAMIRMDVFRKVGGFDERFIVGFNDTDLCLRIVEAGFKVLYDGFTVLYHHESATRTESKSVDHPDDDARLRKRWATYFRNGDPFYNPLLAPKGTDHTLRQDQGCKGRMAPRVVTLSRAAAPEKKPQRNRREMATGTA